MRASAGVLSALRELQSVQAQTRFSQVSPPPRDLGVTWSSESSLLGNACVQLLGLGAFASLGEARAAVRRSFDGLELEPRRAVPDVVRERFARLARPPSRGEPS